MNKQEELNSRNIKSKNDNESNNLIDMNSLLINLKNEDKRTIRKMKNMRWLYIAMIIVYTLLMIVNPDPELQMHHRISGLCYVISFAMFALLFQKYQKEFSSIDYSLSSSDMFTRAAERYNLNFRRYLLVIPPLLLIDAGLTISEYYRWTTNEPLVRILHTQALYLVVIIIGWFIGYLIWRRRQKPLRDGALQIVKELHEL
jgi:hypothetical protein